LGEVVDQDGTPHLHASTRLVPPGVAFAEASIGRVVTAPAARGGGIGHALMAESVRLLEQLWGPQPIRIGAQAHLEGFYNRHGFVSDDKPYIEDGIPHIEMLRR
jgi:ElaA protein